MNGISRSASQVSAITVAAPTAMTSAPSMTSQIVMGSMVVAP